jgi:hypothetical protein
MRTFCSGDAEGRVVERPLVDLALSIVTQTRAEVSFQRGIRVQASATLRSPPTTNLARRGSGTEVSSRCLVTF